MADIMLADLRRGEKAVIAALPSDVKQLRKLLVFGVLPGVEIGVLQVSPGFVITVGNTVLAVDKEIACRVKVQRGALPAGR